MSDDLEWYPFDLVDEVCPPHKSSPDEFLFVTDGCLMLGYGPDQNKGARNFVDEEERALYNRKIAVGEVIDFITCDRLGDVDVDVTFHRDGTHEVHGALPADYNWVRIEGDQDTLCESFDDLIAATKRHASTRGSLGFWIDPFLLSQPGVQSVRLTLQFAKWSDELPHRLMLIDGALKFVALSEIN